MGRIFGSLLEGGARYEGGGWARQGGARVISQGELNPWTGAEGLDGSLGFTQQSFLALIVTLILHFALILTLILHFALIN